MDVRVHMIICFLCLWSQHLVLLLTSNHASLSVFRMHSLAYSSTAITAFSTFCFKSVELPKYFIQKGFLSSFYSSNQTKHVGTNMWLQSFVVSVKATVTVTVRLSGNQKWSSMYSVGEPLEDGCHTGRISVATGLANCYTGKDALEIRNHHVITWCRTHE